MKDHRNPSVAGARTKQISRRDLEAELDRRKQECDDYRTGWQRCQADFANFQRRSEEDRHELRDRIERATLLKLAPIIDDFRRAFAHLPAAQQEEAWVVGLRQVEKSLRRLLTDAGFLEIPTDGPFDPNVHEAISHEDHLSLPEGHIIDTLQTGWSVHGVVAKPAQVRVSRGKITRRENS